MIFQKCKTQKAITLTELIVSTMILGIIMTGIVSLDHALQVSSQGTSRNALVAMRTSAIMQHIIKNAQLAKGDSNTEAIMTESVGPTFTIRIRQEGDVDPPTLATEKWATYTYSSATHVILFCETPNLIINCIAGNNIGTLSNMQASVINDPVKQRFYFETTLTNRLDLNASADPFENPEMTLTSQTSPLSWSNN